MPIPVLPNQGEFFAAVFEQSPDPILVLAADGRPLAANDSFRMLTLGGDWLARPQTERQAVLNGLALDDAQTRDFLVRAFSEPPREAEGRFATKDGRSAAIWMRPIWSGEGEFLGRAFYGRDVSTQAEAERARVESEQRLALAQSIAGIGTWEWDFQSGRVTRSPELLAILGRQGDAAAGTYDDYLNAVHPLDRKSVAASGRALRKAGHESNQHRIVRPDGTIRWVEGRGRLWYDVLGRATGAMGVTLDITDQRAAAALLSRERERADLLANVGAAIADTRSAQETVAAVANCAVDHFVDAALVKTRDGRTAESFAARLPNTRRAMFARRLRDLLPVDDNPGNALPARASDAESSYGLVLPLRYDGEILGTLVVVRDHTRCPFDDGDRGIVSELARRLAIKLRHHEFTAQLQRASEIKDEILGMVSHELRTPLTTLLGNANALRRHGDNVPDESRTQALRDIESDAERLHEIVENMLVLARLDVDAEPLMEPVLLQRILPPILKEQRFSGPQVVTLDIHRDLPPVLGHAGYIRQVVVNLLSNASKYGGAGPVEITAVPSEGGAAIHVADRGPGISDELAARVFSPFVRAGGTTGTHGLGLGLTVCKRLVEAQGGGLALSSRPGGGATFTVNFRGVEQATEN